MKPGFVTSLNKISQLSETKIEKLNKVTEVFPFYSNEYYLSLIDWDDPDDPLKKIIIPSTDELKEWGSLDPSSEEIYTITDGLEHKYSPTALLLASSSCASLCRFCFRKRIFMGNSIGSELNYDNALKYIKKHKEINNVLITGGDPLMLPQKDIEELINSIFAIEHIKVVRIGTKVPVVNPYIILNDENLAGMISRLNEEYKSLYIITDINHPKELTDEARKALKKLISSGAVILNQTPLLKGVNDNPKVMAELLNILSSLNIAPYYIFQCRPAKGNSSFSIPIEKGYEIFEKAKRNLSGLAKRSRFIMSHKTGKIEILAMMRSSIIFKYHNAADVQNESRVMIFKRNPEALWFDDYKEMIDSYSVDEEVTG